MDRYQKPLSTLVKVEELLTAPPADFPWLGFLGGLIALAVGLGILLLSRTARLAVEERDDAEDAPLL